MSALPDGNSGRAPPAVADAELAERIVEAALMLADTRGWDGVHLHELADTLGVPLADIARCFAGKDAIAEAWFDRADRALLAAPADPQWRQWPVRERLQRAIFVWLDALGAHRGATAQMLRYKLQPEHLHLQVLGLMRVSRTVQWVREAAGITSVGLRRELEEAALTAIYLATLATWLGDDSAGAERTRAFLERALRVAEGVALRLHRDR